MLCSILLGGMILFSKPCQPKIEIIVKPPVVAEVCNYDSPSHKCLQSLYKRAGKEIGYDWQVLEAVHQIETGKSGNRKVESYAGAQGPMQFLPSTFKRYATDGDQDGDADINSVEDAVFAAAKYLKACSDNLDDQLFCYNHSWEYVSDVKSILNSVREL